MNLHMLCCTGSSHRNNIYFLTHLSSQQPTPILYLCKRFLTISNSSLHFFVTVFLWIKKPKKCIQFLFLYQVCYSTLHTILNTIIAACMYIHCKTAKYMHKSVIIFWISQGILNFLCIFQFKSFFNPSSWFKVHTQHDDDGKWYDDAILPCLCTNSVYFELNECSVDSDCALTLLW